MASEEKTVQSDLPTSQSTQLEQHAELERKITRLKLELALALRELRLESGYSPSDMAKQLGWADAEAVAFERAGNHTLEALMRYLDLLDAELLVMVRQGNDTLQVSDDGEMLLVGLPRQVDQWAEAQGLSLDEFVLKAVRAAHEKAQHYDF